MVEWQIYTIRLIQPRLFLQLFLCSLLALTPPMPQPFVSLAQLKKCCRVTVKGPCDAISLASGLGQPLAAYLLISTFQSPSLVAFSAKFFVHRPVIAKWELMAVVNNR